MTGDILEDGQREAKAEGNLHGAGGGGRGTHRWFRKTNFPCHSDLEPQNMPTKNLGNIVTAYSIIRKA